MKKLPNYLFRLRLNQKMTEDREDVNPPATHFKQRTKIKKISFNLFNSFSPSSNLVNHQRCTVQYFSFF